MTEISHDSGEFTYDWLDLETITLEEMHDIILESNHVFLAPANDPDQTTEKILADMANDPKFSLRGYKLDGRVISYIVGVGYKKDPAVTAIGPMYVAAGHQGHRLGSGQVDEFVHSARAEGYAQVYTKTWSGNADSRRIFESRGFKPGEPKLGDRVNGDDTVEYWLPL